MTIPLPVDQSDKTKKRFKTTPEDAVLRQSVANLILQELADGRSHFYAGGFPAWGKAHRKLLVGLFGGQGGVQNMSRIISFVRREREGRRRQPAEILCWIADRLVEGSLATVEPGLAIQLPSLDATLRRMLLNRDLTDALLAPMPPQGLTDRTRFDLLQLLTR
jgi:hypothetical protein